MRNIKLAVSPTAAFLTKNLDFLVRMDPYCLITCGGHTVRTQVAKNGGKEPVWNETFEIMVSPMDTLVVEVWDKDTFTSDDLVGLTQIPVQRILMMGNLSEGYSLGNNGSPVGQIEITFKVLDNPMVRMAQQAMQVQAERAKQEANRPANDYAPQMQYNRAYNMNPNQQPMMNMNQQAMMNRNAMMNMNQQAMMNMNMNQQAMVDQSMARNVMMNARQLIGPHQNYQMGGMNADIPFGGGGLNPIVAEMVRQNTMARSMGGADTSIYGNLPLFM